MWGSQTKIMPDEIFGGNFAVLVLLGIFMISINTIRLIVKYIFYNKLVLKP
jgi:hypothetical protein